MDAPAEIFEITNGNIGNPQYLISGAFKIPVGFEMHQLREVIAREVRCQVCRFVEFDTRHEVDPAASLESVRALKHYDPSGVFSHPKTLSKFLHLIP